MSDSLFAFFREKVELGEIKDPTSLKEIGDIYKDYLEDLGWNTNGYKQRIKEEAKIYFKNYAQQKRVGNKIVKNFYSDIDWQRLFPERFDSKGEQQLSSPDNQVKLDELVSSQFNFYAKSHQPAQYAVIDESTGNWRPEYKWENNHMLADEIDQTKLHYIILPRNVIRLDFDAGSLEENWSLAQEFPETYIERSRSGTGLHAHYIYDGDIFELQSSIADKPIEIKLHYKPNGGDRPARRLFSGSNGVEVLTHLKPGQLPLKEKRDMLQDVEPYLQTESLLRHNIKAAINKEHHGHTAPEVSFIKHVLDEAVEQGLEFDLDDLRQDVLAFAMSSSHQAEASLKLYQQMTFNTMPQVDIDSIINDRVGFKKYDDEDLIFFDIEVFKDLFTFSYKKYGEPGVTTLINPSAFELEALAKHPLVGFNNLKYDNQIVYLAIDGASVPELFDRSQQIIEQHDNKRNYSADLLSYADIYDFAGSGNKQGLKKWEVELGLKFNELDIDWNLSVEENAQRLGYPSRQALIDVIVEYNQDDVNATEEVFKHLHGDYLARLILADLADMPVMSTTNNLTKKIIFQGDDHPENKLNYTDLSEQFPGYTFDKYATNDKSHYKGVIASEGGYVYSKPGVYKDVVELDVTQMHPSSMVALNYYGPYQERFNELLQLTKRLKHPDEETIAWASSIWDGKLAPYLKDASPQDIKDLRSAGKTAVNSTYGLTSATFPNAFKHPDNIDNIVAKRGALSMIDLRFHLEGLGYEVIHIKTDSIKIANATVDIIHDAQSFMKDYGYDMEIAGEYDRMALTNKSFLIAHYKDGDELAWHGIGADFIDPYIYKTLFTGEELDIKDYFEAKSTVKDPMYLDDIFVGKTGEFFASRDGHELYRLQESGKHAAISGTKGWLWLPSSEFKSIAQLDMAYYDDKINKVLDKIKAVGDISILLPGYTNTQEVA
jgi:uncharacterized protein YprB with RNaseH-like and TPR domain